MYMSHRCTCNNTCTCYIDEKIHVHRCTCNNTCTCYTDEKIHVHVT